MCVIPGMRQQSWRSTGTCATEFLLFQMRPRQCSPCMQCLKESRLGDVSKSTCLSTETTDCWHLQDQKLEHRFLYTCNLDALLRVCSALGWYLLSAFGNRQQCTQYTPMCLPCWELALEENMGHTTPSQSRDTLFLSWNQVSTVLDWLVKSKAPRFSSAFKTGLSVFLEGLSLNLLLNST